MSITLSFLDYMDDFRGEDAFTVAALQVAESIGSPNCSSADARRQAQE